MRIPLAEGYSTTKSSSASDRRGELQFVRMPCETIEGSAGHREPEEHVERTVTRVTVAADRRSSGNGAVIPPPTHQRRDLPGRALAVASAAKRLGENTLLLVVPTDADIESTVGDISFFLSVLEGSAAAVVERQVLPFPSTQVDP